MSSGPSCKECSTGVEYCAFCEREDCPEMMCYRCLRAALGLLLPEPHVHGG
jgi:hypothetical protein